MQKRTTPPKELISLDMLVLKALSHMLDAYNTDSVFLLTSDVTEATKQQAAQLGIDCYITDRRVKGTLKRLRINRQYTHQQRMGWRVFRSVVDERIARSDINPSQNASTGIPDADAMFKQQFDWLATQITVLLNADRLEATNPLRLKLQETADSLISTLENPATPVELYNAIGDYMEEQTTEVLNRLKTNLHFRLFFPLALTLSKSPATGLDEVLAASGGQSTAPPPEEKTETNYIWKIWPHVKNGTGFLFLVKAPTVQAAITIALREAKEHLTRAYASQLTAEEFDNLLSRLEVGRAERLEETFIE
ncbi:MAG TPA: hypothetical protein VKA60_10615 [Blastocatellia bacterium]|nr:hypothetical protein [Blastocatellia bacterium]